jgi:hypothetical protein
MAFYKMKSTNTPPAATALELAELAPPPAAALEHELAAASNIYALE